MVSLINSDIEGGKDPTILHKFFQTTDEGTLFNSFYKPDITPTYKLDDIASKEKL